LVHTSEALFRKYSTTAKAIHDTAHDTAHDTIHDTIHDTKFIAIENLSHRVLWLLNNEMSKDELMAALELKNRDNFQKTYIKPAVEVGLIELTLPAKKT
jgi:ATP-dependent DNA helicase RecG